MEQAVRSCHHLEVNHCLSCHDDHDEGYEMIWRVNWDLGWEAEVCCAVSLAIDGAEKVARAKETL